MSIAALIRNMAAAGAPPEAIALAVEAIEAAQSQDAARRAKQAERKARSRAGQSRDSHGTVTGQECDDPSPSSLPEKKVSPDPSKKTNPPSAPIPSSQPSAVRSAPGRERGSRVDGFEPDLDAAIELGLSPQRARLQGDKFLDFWRAKPGKDGVKLDWPATWRNWIRSEIERNGIGQRASAPQGRAPPPNAPSSQYGLDAIERLRSKLPENQRAPEPEPEHASPEILGHIVRAVRRA